ncbi:MAG: hypothetical protein HY951_13800 [Bacteroidia bacterium]|nr:hypothetical protein [Bacteroidia bacterium]
MNIYLLLFFTGLLAVSCSPSTEEAVKYNDLMIDEQLKISTLFDSLNYCLDSNISKKLLPTHNKIIKQIEESTIKINQAEAFDKTDEYKKNIMSLFEVYKDIATNEYNQIINIYLLPDSLYTIEDENKLNNYWNNAYKKIQLQLLEFNKFQEEFSRKYNFKLEEIKSE